MGQVVSITLPDPDGNGPLSAPRITRSFNARGDLVSQTDAMGNTTAWTYNARRQILTQTDSDPDGAGPLSSPVTSFTYDLAGQRTSITDPVGNITSSVYDHAGRLVEEIDPRGHSTFFHYNTAGEVTRVVDRNSRKRDFTYNDLGLVTQEAWVDGFGNTVKTITHVYDDAGRETSSTDEVTSYQYQYDLADRVIQVDNAGGLVPEIQLDFQYDFEGNRTWMGDSLGGAIGYTWANQRLQSMRMTSQNKSAQVDFGHDSMGRLSSTSRITNDNPATTINTAYTLDLLDRVTAITHQKGVGESTSNLSQFSYSYDANGRVVSSTGPEGSFSFALDANGQLLSVNGSRTESYGYDANGNRSSSATGAGNLLLNDSQYSYTYDFVGNRKTRIRLSDGQITEYYWDHRNQLTLALVKDANGVILKELRFTYDVEGRRVGTWVDADGAGPLAGDQVWTVFDGANPYMDLNAEGQVKTRYLHGPGIDELFARIGAGEDPEWYFTDRLGSVRQIVDGSGTILDEISYDSYGNILSETNPSQGDRFKFTGREFNPELGIYYYRARWYDPSTGQFISQDPIGFSAGDPNLYRYVGNGPGDATDPLGLWESLWDEAKGVFGYIFSNKVETIKLTALGVGEGFNNFFIKPAFRTGQFFADSIIIIGWNPNHDPWNPYLKAYLNNRISYFEAWYSITLDAETTFLTGCIAARSLKTPFPVRSGINPIRGGVGPVVVGQQGLLATGITQNTARIPSLTGTAAFRIPDGLNHSTQIISEIKNVERLTYTSQLRDYALWAQGNGYIFELWVRSTTLLSGPLQQAVANGQIVLRFLP